MGEKLGKAEFDKIKAYYKLCAIEQGGRQHILGAPKLRDVISVIYTKKDIETFFIESLKGTLQPRENIIGGIERGFAKGRIMVI